MTLDSLGGPYKRDGEGQRQRETGDAVLLAVRMEDEAVSQGCGASRSWKSPCSLGASRRTSPAQAWIQPHEA